jgi:hypothetical protein
MSRLVSLFPVRLAPDVAHVPDGMLIKTEYLCFTESWGTNTAPKFPSSTKFPR